MINKFFIFPLYFISRDPEFCREICFKILRFFHIFVCIYTSTDVMEQKPLNKVIYAKPRVSVASGDTVNHVISAVIHMSYSK